MNLLYGGGRGGGWEGRCARRHQYHDRHGHLLA